MGRNFLLAIHLPYYLFLMKTITKPRGARIPALDRWSAFGASALVGLTAGILWAPASGQHSRTRLAARFRDWSRTLTGRWNTWPLARTTRRPAPAAAPDLAMRPERLLTE